MSKKLETKYSIKGEDKTKAAFRSVKKGLGDTEKAAKSLSGKGGLGGTLSTLESFSASMGPAGIAAGVFAGLIGSATLALKTMSVQLGKVDQIGKMAQKLGIATDELGRLHYAAKITGANVDQMNNALRTMRQRVGEAALGTGEAKVFMEKLGLSIADLKRQTPDQMFDSMRRKLRGVANESEQAAFASKMFGEDVANHLLPIIRMTDEEFRNLKASAKLVFTDSDAQKAADYADAVADLSDSWSKLTTDITLQAAPWVTDLVKALNGFIKGPNEDFIRELAEYERKKARKDGYIIQGPEARRRAEESFKLYGNFPSQNADPLFGGTVAPTFGNRNYSLEEKFEKQAADYGIDLMKLMITDEGVIAYVSKTAKELQSEIQSEINRIEGLKIPVAPVIKRVHSLPTEMFETVSPELEAEVEFGQETLDQFEKDTQKAQETMGVFTDSLTAGMQQAGDAIMDNVVAAIFHMNDAMISAEAIAKSLFSGLLKGLFSYGFTALGGAIGGPVGAIISGGLGNGVASTTNSLAPIDAGKGGTTIVNNNHNNSFSSAPTFNGSGDILSDPIQRRKIARLLLDDIEQEQKTYFKPVVYA